MFYLLHVVRFMRKRLCLYMWVRNQIDLISMEQMQKNISRNTIRYFGVIYFQMIFVLLANASKSKVTPSKLGLSKIFDQPVINYLYKKKKKKKYGGTHS